MARQQVATTAASLLSGWTDADTAMQIVGTSLGLFGTGLLDPGPVLSKETPLRNALFDVLLSLVEGGAVELRSTEDAGYAFRWRSDYAVAGVSPATSSTIDLAVPSPYLAELARAQRERDDALGRAEFAEALVTERERQLRMAEAPSARPAKRPTLRPARRREAEPAVDIDLTESATLEVVSDASPASPAPVAPPPAAPPTATHVVDAPAVTHEPAPVEVTVAAPETVLAEPESEETPGAAIAETAAEPKAATPKKAAAKKAAPKKAVRKKPARKKAAPKKIAAATAPEPEAEPEPEEPTAPESSDVIYLTQPAPEDAEAPQPKWSGYTIDKPRSHLSSVDRLADQI